MVFKKNCLRDNVQRIVALGNSSIIRLEGFAVKIQHGNCGSIKEVEVLGLFRDKGKFAPRVRDNNP